MSTTNLRLVPEDDGVEGSVDPIEVTDAIAAAVRGLRYGSVEVVVHDARVVQVVRIEKRRIAK
jgi:hypothetical protein